MMGYETAYLNTLQVTGAEISVFMDRVFSPPGDLATQLLLSDAKGSSTTRDFEPAQNFALFLRDVVQRIESGNFREFDLALLESAEDLQRVRASARAV